MGSELEGRGIIKRIRLHSSHHATKVAITCLGYRTRYGSMIMPSALDARAVAIGDDVPSILGESFGQIDSM